jgi:H/ACA ribonucleoprotein complex subunit 4
MNSLPFTHRKYDVFIKHKAIGEYGIKPEDRPIKDLLDKGVVVINKPKGPTSHMVSEYVKTILKIKKAGHGGTLDPAVTGTLPVALGNATKIVQALLPSGKEYVCIMRLHSDVSEENIREAFTTFTGKITQLPPVKSAVKREERERDIYYLDIIEIEGRDVLFKMGCQAGTYVRKICHDIGTYLKTAAHMAQLIRTQAGPFTLQESVTLEDLEDAQGFYEDEQNETHIRQCIKPLESAVQHLPKIVILDSTIVSVSHGSNVKIPGIHKVDSDIKKGQLVAVMTIKGELVALGTTVLSAKSIMSEEKGIAVIVKKVFVSTETIRNL